MSGYRSVPHAPVVFSFRLRQNLSLVPRAEQQGTNSCLENRFNNIPLNESNYDLILNAAFQFSQSRGYKRVLVTQPLGYKLR
jgi:hypothetical protein